MISFAPPLGTWVSPALPCGRWLLVENPSAGSSCAPQAARDLAAVLRREGQDVLIYDTRGDVAQCVGDIARFLKSYAPSLVDPVGVLALGGDGTTNDALRGLLQYIFPNPFDLIDGPIDEAMERMLESGLQLGNVRMGGSSQLGQIHGAPLPQIDGILEFLRTASVTPLNLGMASLDNGVFHFFSHNASAGRINAPVYEATRGERGKIARYHQKALGLWNLLKGPEPFRVRWLAEDGYREAHALEVLIHPTPRARNTNGLPGTPAAGLGVKILPAEGLTGLMRFHDEVRRRGQRVAHGDLAAIDPRGLMDALPAELQMTLNPGEEIELSFRSLSGRHLRLPVQAGGDYLGRCRSLWIRALAPFPRFLVSPNSVMDRLRTLLRPAGTES